MNKIIEIGRTTHDIELKVTPSGTSVASFSIAVKKDFKNAEGKYDSDFFDCVAYGKLAETISRYVHKGDMLGVIGKLQTRAYTDKNGNNRRVTEIIANEIEFLTPKKEDNLTEQGRWEEVDPFAVENAEDTSPF